MNEKKYQKRIDFQNDIITKKNKENESLKLDIAKLKLQLKEKEEIINSVNSLRNELSQDVSDVKKYKERYKELVEELREMKEVMDNTVFKGRWRLVRFLIKLLIK